MLVDQCHLGKPNFRHLLLGPPHLHGEPKSDSNKDHKFQYVDDDNMVRSWREIVDSERTQNLGWTFIMSATS